MEEKIKKSVLLASGIDMKRKKEQQHWSFLMHILWVFRVS